MTTAAHPNDPRHQAICAVCQANARQEAGELGIDLYRVWSNVAAEAWASDQGVVEGWAARALRSPGLARALVTTPSLVLSWIAATVIVIVLGIVATNDTGTAWVHLVSPLLAAAGIAFAYGPGIDPAFELSRSMAISDRMVLLTRALAVFGLNALFGVAASLLTSSTTGITIAWLAPMTAMAMLALAIASVTHSPGIGVAGAFGVWSIVVLASEIGAGSPDAALATVLAPLYFFVAIGGCAVALYFSSGRRERVLTW